MVSIVLHGMSLYARHDERRETSAFKSVKVELDER
jgi:hypothetical protein